ncbi:2-hydroxyacid dehydrogenase [Demequina sp. TTPB684]|uniref:2-hydroxyacid dehydrogenase n=1 Tax=unclassified Demequina TaxID=2620311 RepID=UPI001CF3A500|nr:MULTISPECIES: 2-hydroxyacid dehydrogenase [unclassified Demequina]MCB2413444.1 2-hydroxyacid dehydrogenase [Demequina sp. TTPB684]UPU88749.1 2-hydroxyacid dehydrogenase [Demequina sp. TMPB413]
MITVSVPEQAIADALGPVGDDARIVVWDPAASDPPEDERDRITIACLAHDTGGRTVYGRLATCGHLKVIQIPSAGFEHALPFVPDGVSLANARGVHDSRVAEMTLALALASRRLLPRFLDAQRRETWEPEFDSRSLADSRALVVGYGSIGEAIGVRLRASEVHVEGVARSARTARDGTAVHAVEDLPELLPHFDIVVIVTPHTDQTDQLVDAEFLAAMPDGALLINVGRGKVVDTDALLEELRSRRLFAALDVTDPEPLPTGHPLWSAPQCIVVPHVAGVEVLTNRRFTDLVRLQIDARRRGDDPVNFVAMGSFPA